MNNCLKITLLVLLLIPMLQAKGSLIPETQTGKAVESDSTQRVPTSEAMSKYYASEDYNYKEEVKPKSWWDYVKEFLLKWIKRVGLGSSQLLGLLIVAGAAALIWLVIIITNTPVKGLFYFSKNSALVSIPLKAESDINNPELESMLALLVKHKAYREAVRIRYLLMLKQLHENRIINWNNHKTNRDYQREMGNHPLLQQFRELTYHYEYSWYGHFMVDDALFENISQQYSDFKKALNP
ncbi:MAG: DUF4129 domain-containing protein [Breznakibacter sp.]|nr:DUF4129 domain-containing protein [Breznakibacter sp.]